MPLASAPSRRLVLSTGERHSPRADAQALPNVRPGFFQLAQSREIAADGTEDAADGGAADATADAAAPEGEIPEDAGGRDATGRDATAGRDLSAAATHNAAPTVSIGGQPEQSTTGASRISTCTARRCSA